jgi:hypothetical protein
MRMVLSSKQLVVGSVLLSAVVLTIHAASQEPPPASAPGPQLGSLTSLRGLDVAVRAEGEADFGEKTPRMALEAFRDEDFGTLTYLTARGRSR